MLSCPVQSEFTLAPKKGCLFGRSQNGSWEKNTVAFESGTIDAVDGPRSQPNIVYLGVTQDASIGRRMLARAGAGCSKEMSAPSRWIPPMLSLGDLIFSVLEHRAKKFVQ
jgi:hypothetical protein